MRLHPFRALRPAPELAERVAAVPYDVVNRSEAAALAAGNPHSFLHVGRSDIDLPPDVDPYDPRIYSKAREALDRFQADGTLLREAQPSLYLYRQTMDGRAQTGVVGCVHIDDYDRDIIRKHEKTRRDKEDDRTRHVLTLRANAEPVFLTYRARPDVRALAEPVLACPPLYDFTAPDGVRHTVWRITDPAPFVDAFRQIPHCLRGGRTPPLGERLAGRTGAPQRPSAASGRWGVQLVPRRAVPGRRAPDPSVQSRRAGPGRARLGRPRPALTRGPRERHRRPDPPRPGTFGVFLMDAWYRLELDEATIDRSDPIASLDVSLLQDRVLGPILASATRAPTSASTSWAASAAPRSSSAGSARARWRSPSPCIPPRSNSSWRCPTLARSCRPRAPGSSPSCAAGSSCIPCRLIGSRAERRTS